MITAPRYIGSRFIVFKYVIMQIDQVVAISIVPARGGAVEPSASKLGRLSAQGGEPAKVAIMRKSREGAFGFLNYS